MSLYQVVVQKRVSDLRKLHPLIFFRNNDGSTCTLRATCTIRKGEEITDNYGLFYQLKNEEQRQEALLIQYFFQCQCMACKLHWPIFPGMTAQRLRVKRHAALVHVEFMQSSFYLLLFLLFLFIARMYSIDWAVSFSNHFQSSS